MEKELWLILASFTPTFHQLSWIMLGMISKNAASGDWKDKHWYSYGGKKKSLDQLHKLSRCMALASNLQTTDFVNIHILY